MKRIFATAIAAAALFSLASCQKQSADAPAKTDRVITGEFSNDGTKTTLDEDGKTPLWSVGDVIRVLNSTSYEDITLAADNISEDKKKITFTTSLAGMLYAVYPASVTTMTSCSDGDVTFTIPTIQDGKFGSANICVASGDGETSTEIYFSNATAVVEMTVKSGVVYANLTAANKIAGDMCVAMGNKGEISSTTTGALSSNYIFVSDSPSGGKFYMAVASGETGAVTITCNTLDKSGSIVKSAKTLVRDHIYAMDLSSMSIDIEDLTGQHGVQNGQEFVIIKGSDSEYLKWATQNLAVTASGKAKWNGTNYVIGDYFQWAASYDGYGLEGTKRILENLVIYDSFTNTCAGGESDGFTFKTGKSNGFAKDSNAPYCNGSAYTKYTSGSATLESSDDIASIVLGGTWRMPTGGSDGQFKAMRAVTYWAWDGTDKGYYVFKPGVGTSGAASGRGTIAETDDKNKALLFFPAAGNGSGTNLDFAGSNGYYWSSTLYSFYTELAYLLYFHSSDVDPENINLRYLGFPVRPVSE